MNIEIKDLLIPVFTAIVAYLIWRIQFQKTKIKDIEKQLSEKKYIVYSEIFYLMFDQILPKDFIKAPSTKELAIKIAKIKKDLYIYAPDKIIRKYTEWSVACTEKTETLSNISIYIELLVLIRKDMGHTNTTLNMSDFMRFLLQSDKESEKFINDILSESKMQ